MVQPNKCSPKTFAYIPIMFNEMEPDIKLVGLSIWILGYQYPDSSKYWDANWVVVRVCCIGQCAVVELCDPCIHLPELAAWLDACIALEDGRSERAELPTMEPYLQITIDRSGDYRGLVVKVKVTPDNVTQFHEFHFPIDSSYLRILIEALRGVLARLPIRFVEDR